MTVTVENVNEPPVVTGPDTFTYRENGASVHTFRAVDPERSHIIWSLSGPDNHEFTISETGVLSFTNPPDYENPTDSGRDNVYKVTVVARDDAFNFGTLNVTITVTVGTDSTVGDQYDVNNNGVIDKAEVIAAFRDYVNGKSDKAQIIEIFRLYVTG